MAIRRAFWTVRVGGADGAGARVPMMAVIDIPIIVIARQFVEWSMFEECGQQIWTHVTDPCRYYHSHRFD
ncbi:hypothetical protein BLOT_003867 [Blomia tropicalis]|nr:hypothetical protein BLOT_003867 [Blomia tropicalis]